MLPQYRISNRAKVYYSMVLTLPAFILCSTVAYAVLYNGMERDIRFLARDSNLVPIDPIVKTYYLYFIPPPAEHPEYQDWLGYFFRYKA